MMMGDCGMGVGRDDVALRAARPRCAGESHHVVVAADRPVSRPSRWCPGSQGDQSPDRSIDERQRHVTTEDHHHVKMSLACIAIAISVLVDLAIMVSENALLFFEQRWVDPRDRWRLSRPCSRRSVWSGARSSSRDEPDADDRGAPALPRAGALCPEFRTSGKP